MATAFSPPVPGSLLRDLRGVVGAGALIEDPGRLLVYESDGLTTYRRRPGAVVLPGSAGEVRGVVELLARAGVPFVARGAGTGLSGGALADEGSVVVSTARLSRVLEVDEANRRARVEPGVLNSTLGRAAEAHGLHYVPDPSSQTACTIGGNVAENSGGPHCLKYGVTSRYVTGLTVVLPDGEAVTLGGLGRAPGPLDLVGLFVGSEGCFGIATEVEVRLLPLPPGVRTLLAIFETLEAAGSAVSRILAEGLLPAALEIIDRETIRAVEASVFAAGYPTDAAAALVIELDGLESGLDDQADAAAEACRAEGAVELRRARSEEERQALWKGRKKAFGAMGRIAPDLLVQDATVPRTRLPSVLARIAEIGRRHDLTLANVFHAGDGNLHPNLLFDRRDPEEVARVEAASKEIMQVCVDAGGTITGEHGVGVDKRRYMPLVYGPGALDAMERVRRAFDPAGICNPGKVLPDGVGARVAAREGGRAEAGDGREGKAAAGGRGTTVEPESEAESARVLRAAAEDGVRVRLSGRPSRTRDPGRLTVALHRIRGVVEYEPGDLTITVHAGTPVEEVLRAVRAEGQWLPIPWRAGDRGTVGGWAAAGVPGLLSTSFGAPRDLVLGLRLATSAGEVLGLGGKVVKNVAGFDLVKAVVGSRGTLGAITSLTLRLYPAPTADRTLLHRESAVEAVRAAAEAPVVPASAALHAAGGGRPTGAIRLLGTSAELEEAARILRKACGAPSETLEGAASEAFWGDAVRETEAGETSLLLARLPAGLAELAGLAAEAGGDLDGADWTADAHTGLMRVLVPEERARGMLERLGGRPAEAGAPGGVPAIADGLVRGMRSMPPRARAARLVRDVRLAFDPSGILFPTDPEAPPETPR